MRRKKRDYDKDPMDLSRVFIPIEIDHQELDDWQNEVVDYEGDIAICSGRQVGKSACMSLKCALTALRYMRMKILISSGSERQAAYIYEKIKQVLKQAPMDVFADNPTMRFTKLKNGTEIYCLPTGQTGDLIRGLTLDVWIPDEAAYINDAVWATVSPMLWIARQNGRGWIWALSTPAGKRGKFYECFSDPRFKIWRISAINCKRIPHDELERWKRQYSRVQYAQEVLGEFVDEISRFFSDDLIRKCMKHGVGPFAISSKYLGVDVARYGGDENAFVTVCENDKKYRVIASETTERVGIHETFSKIIELDKNYHFNRILIDDAGVGGGLTDFLMEKLQNRVIGINNAQRSISHDKKKKRRILKEDIYSNAIILMEQSLVEIEYNDDLFLSLSSVLYEYTDKGTVKIYGRYSHLAEAFVRALWGAKRKSLNLWASSPSLRNKQW